jgi:hypothetical protein
MRLVNDYDLVIGDERAFLVGAAQNIRQQIVMVADLNVNFRRLHLFTKTEISTAAPVRAMGVTAVRYAYYALGVGGQAIYLGKVYRRVGFQKALKN